MLTLNLNSTLVCDLEHVSISRAAVVSQIVGDAVGWGFVVRGSKPCHIQAVDPGGPAAAAGMKVGPGQACGALKPTKKKIMCSTNS